MAVARRDTSPVATSSTTTLTVSYPSNAIGDIILLTLSINSVSVPTVPAPSGWTSVNYDGFQTATRTYVLWRYVASSALTGSVAITWSTSGTSSGVMTSYSGASAIAPTLSDSIDSLSNTAVTAITTGAWTPTANYVFVAVSNNASASLSGENASGGGTWTFSEALDDSAHSPSLAIIDGPTTGTISALNATASTAAKYTIIGVALQAFSLPYTETYTGTTGNAWPTFWVTSQSAGSGGSATIQSNAGRLYAGSTGTSFMKAYLDAMPLITDTEIYTSFTLGVQTAAYFNFQLNADNTQYSGNPGEMPNNGYTLNFNLSATASASQFDMWKMTGGSNTNMYATTTITLTAGVKYMLRYQRYGTTLRFRLWLASGIEPTIWTASYTDGGTMLSANKVAITSGNNGGGSAYIDYDDLTVRPTPTITLPYTETWTGTTGNAWPTVWSTLVGTLTLNTNAGQLVTLGSSAYAGATGTLLGMPSTTDTDVVVTAVGASAGVEQYAILSINTDGAYNSGASWGGNTGYGLILNYNATPSSSNVQIQQYTSGTYTTIGTSAGMTLVGTTAYRLRLRRVGTALMGKVWAASGAEPAAWTVTATVSSPPSGIVSVGVSNGNDGVARTFTFDDLTVFVPGMGAAKVYDGSVFNAKPIRVWTGSSWATKSAKVWNGSAWITKQY